MKKSDESIIGSDISSICKLDFDFNIWDSDEEGQGEDEEIHNARQRNDEQAEKELSDKEEDDNFEMDNFLAITEDPDLPFDDKGSDNFIGHTLFDIPTINVGDQIFEINDERDFGGVYKNFTINGSCILNLYLH